MSCPVMGETIHVPPGTFPMEYFEKKGAPKEEPERVRFPVPSFPLSPYTLHWLITKYMYYLYP
jgi:hypothetical protein